MSQQKIRQNMTPRGISQANQGIILRGVSLAGGIIPRGVIEPNVSSNLLRVPGESSSPGLHTPASQSPQGMRPWGVTHDPGESTAIS